ncbi:MAG: Gfo/Idh/MocA family oxidoreductase [Planctomycetes bacterium]|nr:Gfo/Idh/MocA family oxidoreductase [Planctomycetota bacterium]
MNRRLKCAVIGASGIGKQHAKWYHIEGCDVTAFAGTSKESIEKTKAVLKDMFGFEGKGYIDIRQMLEAERPDIVSVCSPHHLHGEHARAALQAGANVLCEKPLLWMKDRDIKSMLREAERVLEVAQEMGKILSMNAQYPAGLAFYRQVHVKTGEPMPPVQSMFAHLESRGGRMQTEYEAIWVDLAPHPLSILQKLVPGGRIDENSIKCEISQFENVAAFDYIGPAGGKCEVEIRLGVKKEGDLIRKFGLNGRIVDYSGRNDEKGIYRTVITYHGKDLMFNDLMQLCIRQFIKAVRGPAQPLISATEAIDNLALLGMILERAKKK